MEELIKGSEDIEEVRAYQCPLFGVQLTQYLLNHQFIMLETNSWWWSVEKNTEGITIQRSKKDRIRERQVQEKCSAKGYNSKQNGQGKKNHAGFGGLHIYKRRAQQEVLCVHG